MPGEQLRATQALMALSNGDSKAAEELLPLVYENLRSLAARYMRTERRDHTLQPTALVHEGPTCASSTASASTGRARPTSSPSPRRRCGECSPSMPGPVEPANGVPEPKR